MSGTNLKKIVFLNYWARNMGGAELSLLDIVTEAAKYEKTYLISSENGKLTEEAEKKGTECIIVPFKGSLTLLRRNKLFFSVIVNWKLIIAFVKYVLKCKRVIRQLKPDIVYANVPKSHVILFLLYYLGYSGKMIFHIRELFPKKSFAYLIYYILFPYRNAKAIAVSNAVIESLPKRIRKKTEVIYNGVKINAEIPCKQTQKLRFLFLGRIVPWKRCDVLISAFAKLVAEYDYLAGELDLIGGTFYWDETYREKLNALIDENSVGSRVKLLPFTDRIEEVYTSHNIFCIASDREPFGRVVAEAQGWGLPVIASKTGAISEIIKDNETGFLINNCVCDEFCDAMEKFIKDRSLITKMGIAGYRRTRKLFNKSRQIPLILKSITEHKTKSIENES